METTIAKSISARFPALRVTEDIMSQDSYWVNVRVGNQWLVIQKTSGNEFGISVVSDQSLDFSGHEHVVGDVSEAVDFAVESIKRLSCTASHS